MMVLFMVWHQRRVVCETENLQTAFDYARLYPGSTIDFLRHAAY